MKTISGYTICCTFEQTKKALELGAPIKYVSIGNIKKYHEPTAEQMIGWLEEWEVIRDINITYYEDKYGKGWVYCIFDKDSCVDFERSFITRKEATLAAIDAALEYLSAHK